MVGLLDIAPSTVTVPVEGHDIAVYGVSAQGIAYLIERFPELRELIGGNVDGIDAKALIEKVPDAIAVVIACGSGYVASAEAEALAAKLPADAQIDLLTAILKLTMPKGPGPFVQKLLGMMSLFDVEVKAQATQSQPASNS